MTTPRTKRGRAGTGGVSDTSTPHETAPDRSMAPESVSPVRNDAVAQLAHELFLGRGGCHGHDMDDWLEAERQLRG